MHVSIRNNMIQMYKEKFYYVLSGTLGGTTSCQEEGETWLLQWSQVAQNVVSCKYNITNVHYLLQCTIKHPAYKTHPAIINKTFHKSHSCLILICYAVMRTSQHEYLCPYLSSAISWLKNVRTRDNLSPLSVEMYITCDGSSLSFVVSTFCQLHVCYGVSHICMVRDSLPLSVSFEENMALYE